MLVAFPFSLSMVSGVGYGCINASVAQGRSYLNDNINVSDCFFSRTTKLSGSGGVIYVSGGFLSMSVTNSMFYCCLSDYEGGAIYFDSSNSTIRMICANKCSASGNHFAFLEASQVNQVEYLSFSFCSHTTNGRYSLKLRSGNQRVDNTNSSMNNAEEGSGIGIFPPSTFSSSYCTFSNNKASYGFTLCLSSLSGIISSANIVQNSCPPDKGVIRVEDGSHKMLFCIFRENQEVLFYVNYGSLEIQNSFIHHSGTFSTSTPVSTGINNSVTKTVTYQLTFFNSHYCNTDIPQKSNSLLKTIIIGVSIISVVLVVSFFIFKCSLKKDLDNPLVGRTIL